MVVGKHLICQKVIVPYMKDAENDTLFTMKAIDMKVCKDVYGVRLHLLPRYCKKNCCYGRSNNPRHVDIIKYYGKYSLFP